MNIHQLQLKEVVIKTIREYFYTKGFHEVTIPILQKTIPLEPTIYPFTTNSYVLPTSPESICIQYMGNGGGNCFAIAPAFRYLEQTSPIHTPEFLMLEWYRENSSLSQIMEETKNLILCIQKTCGFKNTNIQSNKGWKQYTMEELFERYCEVSLMKLIDVNETTRYAKKRMYETKSATWEQLFNQIFLNEIEPNLGTDPVFVSGYPSQISPLCTPQKNNPDLAERFELYINGVEIANGNAQNTEKENIKQVFVNEQKLRKQEGLAATGIDMEFLNALKNLQGKNVYGVGLGIDRLTMVLTSNHTIHGFL